MKRVLLLGIAIMSFLSCNQQSSEYKQMKEENDSLKLQIAKSGTELNEMLDIMNSIETDIQSIRQAEDFIKIEKDNEFSDTRREQIRKNMHSIVETVNKNKTQIAELQDRLNKSSVHSAGLQKALDRLSKDLSEKSAQIVKLQEELVAKYDQIRDLTDEVDNLTTDVKILEEVNASQHHLIGEQDRTINNVYYCFGTKKELKEQNIVSGGGLFSKTTVLDGDFNKDYFITIDKRQLKSIPLFSSKAKLLTNHPNNSYRLEKDTNGNLILEIKKVNQFWSMSKYLVIEVG
jgi:septal ring factor EnvC (AmiA/AmiB activator)/hemin uptake protein HemP